jgi:protein O-mannosyl-transferase
MTRRIRVEILVGIAIIVYLNALPNGFTFDDFFYILNNQAVKSGSVTALFEPTPPNNNFRPLSFATFSVNWALGNHQPFGYHLVNVLLHAVVTLLLYLVLVKLLDSVPEPETIALAAALFFAVHPIHTEAVASIVGRSELLAAGFLLAAWFWHLQDRPVFSLACFVLALLSKESAAVFLLLVLAGDYAKCKLKPFSRYAWIAGVTALYVGALWRLQGGKFEKASYSFVDNPLASLPAVWRILNALRVGWKYIGLQIYPGSLSYDYSYNAILLYANWRRTLPAAIAAAVVLTLLLWTARTKRREWMLAGAIYLGSFAVTSNILLSTGTIMGERLAYLPSAGFCLLVALILTRLGILRSTAGWVLVGVLLAALGVRTIIRNRDWRDNFTLFYSGVRAVPTSARAHRNLADEYVKRGQLPDAVKEFQTALQIYPVYPEAIENYGLAEARMGNGSEAKKLLETAVSLSTNDRASHMVMEVNLALHLGRLGQYDEALKLLDEVTVDAPGYPLAWMGRALIRYRRGEVGLARSDAETALRLDPSNSEAQALLKIVNAPAGAPPAN